jgi:altronate dehydratase
MLEAAPGVAPPAEARTGVEAAALGSAPVLASKAAAASFALITFFGGRGTCCGVAERAAGRA